MLLARLALATIALHLVDDAFLQREPGTAASDHLGVLVPLALLVALAVLPAGRSHGAALLVAGLAGVAAGAAVPVAQAVEDGPAGDAWSGLLATVAAAVLAAVAGAELWRERRRAGVRWELIVRRAAVGVAGGFLGASVVAGVAVGFYATHRAADGPRALPPGFAAAHVRTADGLTLTAAYRPSRTGAAVVVLGSAPHARMLARHGLGVLLLDRRGDGGSDGDADAFGWAGETDVRAALGWLARRPDVDAGRIGGLGLSVGGEALLQASARDRRLRAVVSEGAGTRSVREDVELPGVDGVLSAPVSAVTTAVTAAFAGRRPPPRLLGLLPRIAPRRTLLVWSPRGGGGEVMTPAYARAAGPAATVWAVPRGGHVGGLGGQPAEYERRVVGFLAAALSGG